MDEELNNGTPEPEMNQEMDAGSPETEVDKEPEAEAPKPKKKRPVLKALLISLIVLLSLTLVVGLAAWIWVNAMLNKINYVAADESRLSQEEVEQLLQNDTEGETIQDGEILPDIEELEQELMKDPGASAEPMPDGSVKGDVVNILLVGQDRRGEKRARSDSMILVTINKNKNTITFTSFLRDAYVQIPGYKAHKLCHAFQYGGFSLLNETLWVNYGVRVDGNAEVDFNRFMGLIDLLGGVDIELTQKEINYMTNNGSKWPELKKGMNHLTGEQALLYSRIRYIDSDYRRTERQRTVLMSLLNEYKSKPLLEMLDLLDEILPLVTTNMEKSEIVSLATKLFPMAKGATINSQQIPAAGTFKGGSVRVREGLKGWFEYNIDFEKNRQILQDVFDAD